MIKKYIWKLFSYQYKYAIFESKQTQLCLLYKTLSTYNLKTVHFKK